MRPIMERLHVLCIRASNLEAASDESHPTMHGPHLQGRDYGLIKTEKERERERQTEGKRETSPVSCCSVSVLLFYELGILR